MAGGAGDDTYFVDNVGDVVTELTGQGIDTIYAGVNFTLGDTGNGANVENVVLYGAATTVTGNSLDNQLIGNALNNTLGGGVGNDFIDGGTGADAMTGGMGDDVYVVDIAGDSVIEAAGSGTGGGIDTVQSSISFDLASRPDVENVILTGTANINATGNGLNNVLTGNAGNNIMAGGAGSDTYQFGQGSGSDTIVESAAAGTDLLQLLAGISREQVWFRQVGSGLEVSLIGTNDKATIQNWYSGSQYHVE